MREAAHEMVTHGTFRYADAQLPQTELNQLFTSALARAKP
jgi:hypothetical protein